MGAVGEGAVQEGWLLRWTGHEEFRAGGFFWYEGQVAIEACNELDEPLAGSMEAFVRLINLVSGLNLASRICDLAFEMALSALRLRV